MSIWQSPTHWQSAADFLVIAGVIYLLLRWGKEARALRISVIIFFLRSAATLARQLNMTGHGMEMCLRFWPWLFCFSRNCETPCCVWISLAGSSHEMRLSVRVTYGR